MSDPSASDRGQRTRRRRVSRSPWKILAVGTLALVLVLAVAGVVVYQRLDGNITRESITGGLTNRPSKSLDPAQPEDAPQALNILLIGSDTRQGEGNGIDDENPGQRSDTTILMHISADRTFAYGVSIPRDSVVQRPDCIAADGSTLPGALDMWNAAYEDGGTACLVQQTEQLTGVRVDHYVIVDFNGFKQMVDALGGVTICVPEDVNDTTGNIQLDGGTYEVDGQKALDYVRVRYAIGENGDIGRMKRQQTFLASMANKALSVGTLANPAKLYSFLDAATSSVTMDPDLGSLRELTGLARQLRGIGLDNIQFISVPFRTYKPDPNRLVWRTKQADKLWALMREDQPLSGPYTQDVVTAGRGVPGATPSAGASSSASASPGATGSADPSAEESRRAAVAAENGLCS